MEEYETDVVMGCCLKAARQSNYMQLILFLKFSVVMNTVRVLCT